MIRLRLLAVMLAAFAAGAVQGGAITNNGDFETGDLTGWTLVNGITFDRVCSDGQLVGAATCSAANGSYAMTFGHSGSVTTLSQTLTTTPGSTYTLSFYLRNDNPTNSNTETFAVTWDGVPVYSLASLQATFPYMQISLSVEALSGSTVLGFQARHDPSQWFLDDVTVEAAVATEPGTGLLCAFAIACLVLARRHFYSSAGEACKPCPEVR